MVAAVGTTIDRQDYVEDQTRIIRDVITAATTWWIDSGTLPSGWADPNQTGAFRSYLADPGSKDPGGPSTADITGVFITASVLAQAITSWSKTYTNVRLFRFQRTGNLAAMDSTQMTDMSAPYLQPAYDAEIDMAPVNNNIVANAPVTVANETAFLNALLASWNTSKLNTVSYSFYYCHSNCHGNCHGARGWR